MSTVANKRGVQKKGAKNSAKCEKISVRVKSETKAVKVKSETNGVKVKSETSGGRVKREKNAIKEKCERNAVEKKCKNNVVKGKPKKSSTTHKKAHKISLSRSNSSACNSEENLATVFTSRSLIITPVVCGDEIPKYLQIKIPKIDNKFRCLNSEAMDEMMDALQKAANCNDIGAVLITGSGHFFCSGIDLKELTSAIDYDKKVEEIAIKIKNLVIMLSRFPKPIIALVNGITIGFGVSLLTFCDGVLATPDSTFYTRTSELHYLHEGGLLHTLPKIVGLQVAKGLLLFGTKWTSEKAKKLGLVHEIIHEYFLPTAVEKYMKEIVSNSPQRIMNPLNYFMRSCKYPDLEQKMEMETWLLIEMMKKEQCRSAIKNAVDTEWIYK